MWIDAHTASERHRRHEAAASPLRPTAAAETSRSSLLRQSGPPPPNPLGMRSSMLLASVALALGCAGAPGGSVPSDGETPQQSPDAAPAVPADAAPARVNDAAATADVGAGPAE